MVRILKSIPMVVMNEGVHASSQNRRSRHDFPTPGARVSQERQACTQIPEAPESPIKRSCGWVNWGNGESAGGRYLDEEIIVWGRHSRANEMAGGGPC